MFEVGETVVYPRQGAGTVIARGTREVMGEVKEYLTIRIIQSDLTLMVPSDSVEAAGVRRAVSGAALEEIAEVLIGECPAVDGNWNRRFRHHQELLKSSDPREIAELIASLDQRQRDKGLSGGERQLLIRAKRLLASEVQYAKATDERGALDWIEAILEDERHTVDDAA